MAKIAETQERKQTLEERCPLLTSSVLLESFPQIVEVAGYYDKMSRHFRGLTGRYPTFDELRIQNVQDFVGRLEEGNPDAVRLYHTVRDTLVCELDLLVA